MSKKTAGYGNDSITMLKGADKVRKRPAVIFGSDGIDGCEHSVFEVISNSIDEARAGYGDRIIITKFSSSPKIRFISCSFTDIYLRRSLSII